MVIFKLLFLIILYISLLTVNYPPFFKIYLNLVLVESTFYIDFHNLNPRAKNSSRVLNFIIFN